MIVLVKAINLHLQSLSEKLGGSVGSPLQTVVRDEDMSWATREQHALGRIPSRGERFLELNGSRLQINITIKKKKRTQENIYQDNSQCLSLCATLSFSLLVQRHLPFSAVLAPAQWGNLWVLVEGDQ